MARVTVEDCVIKVPNRFKLVMLAAQRSRELSVGGDLTVDRDNDKNPVVALREIADETISLDELENGVVQSLQKNVDVDEPMDEAEEILAVEEALGGMAALEAGEASPFAGAEGGFEDVDDLDDEDSDDDVDGAEGADDEPSEDPDD